MGQPLVLRHTCMACHGRHPSSLVSSPPVQFPAPSSISKSRRTTSRLLMRGMHTRLPMGLCTTTTK